MKTKFIFVVVVIAICLRPFGNCLAQAPKSFKYQAVARDNSGAVLGNHIINFRISILKGSTSGTAVYVETQKDTTNQFGLANLKIGSGIFVSGSFVNINWGGDTYFVKTEMDINAGTNFQLMGTSQLLSVPYALFAEKTGGDGIWTKNNANAYLTDTNGYVGIGTNNPKKPLNVDGESIFTGSMSFGAPGLSGSGNIGSITWGGSPTTFMILSASASNALALNIGGSPLGDFYISTDHYIGIGTTNPQWKLSVNGAIGAKEIIVQTGWSDFVFAKDYKLMNLKELEKFINIHKHLPDIPSTKDIEDNGAALGSISSKLLQKIEELTLYIIDLNKSVEQLKAENAELKKKLNKVK